VKFSIYIDEVGWKGITGEEPDAESVKVELEEALRASGFETFATVEIEYRQD
jgi:hypothetical protein